MIELVIKAQSRTVSLGQQLTLDKMNQGDGVLLVAIGDNVNKPTTDVKQSSKQSQSFVGVFISSHTGAWELTACLLPVIAPDAAMKTN